MKRLVMVFMLTALGILPLGRVYAQQQELQQLTLNIEKLMQFRQILTDMKKGYEILTQGYNAVKNISEGNFSLHKGFLDGLLEVSPAVRKYHKIAAIIRMQGSLVKEYKAAFTAFKSSRLLQPEELDYLSRVYGSLFDASVKQLEALLSVVTAGTMRMQDEERLQAIDRIHAAVLEELQFLRVFNNEGSMLLLQRSKEMNDVKGMDKMYK